MNDTEFLNDSGIPKMNDTDFLNNPALSIVIPIGFFTFNFMLLQCILSKEEKAKASIIQPIKIREVLNKLHKNLTEIMEITFVGETFNMRVSMKVGNLHTMAKRLTMFNILLSLVLFIYWMGIFPLDWLASKQLMLEILGFWTLISFLIFCADHFN
jgi:hypothetical protein